MSANLKLSAEEENERIKQLHEALDEGIDDIRAGRVSPVNLRKTIQRAIENSRQGRKVNPLVAPEDS